MNHFEALKKVTENKNSKVISLVPCGIVNSDYQYESIAMDTFIRNESLRQLKDISPKNLCLQKLLIQSNHIVKYSLLIKI